MTQTIEGLTARLQERFHEQAATARLVQAQAVLEVPADALLAVCTALRDEPEFAFGQLVDLCGVDYLEYGNADWETALFQLCNQIHDSGGQLVVAAATAPRECRS